jgi:hypothetical protein
MIWFKFDDIQLIEFEKILRKIQLNINEAEEFLNKNTVTNLTPNYPPTFSPVDAGCVCISYIHDADLAVVY